MKAVKILKYKCEICKQIYDKKQDALACEERPVSHDDVGVGDVVKILSGDGEGSLGLVDDVWVVRRCWGSEKYWHTVVCSARVIGSYGSRILTFDDRKVVERAPVKNQGGENE